MAGLAHSARHRRRFAGWRIRRRTGPAAVAAARRDRGRPDLCGSAASGLVLGLKGPTAGPSWMTVTFAASFTPLAVFVLRRLPTHPIGHLMLWIGLIAIVATVAVCWSALLPIAWLSQWTWWPPIALIPLLLLLSQTAGCRPRAGAR